MAKQLRKAFTDALEQWLGVEGQLAEHMDKLVKEMVAHGIQVVKVPNVKPQKAEFRSSLEFMAAWHAFVENRKKIKHPMTDHAMDLMLRKLECYPVEGAIQALNDAAVKGYRDVKYTLPEMVKEPPKYVEPTEPVELEAPDHLDPEYQDAIARAKAAISPHRRARGSSPASNPFLTEFNE